MREGTLRVDESCCGSKQVEVSASDYSQFPLGPSLTCSDTDSNSDRLYPLVTIDKLPDDVLLEIFVYVLGAEWDVPSAHEDGWRTLVHVCKRWRSVVFSSPRRLDLQLVCTNTRPVKKLLNIWPPLPIYIFAEHYDEKSPMKGVTNLMAALKQHDRVCNIAIYGVPTSLLKRFLAMKKPFPALTHLELWSNDEKAPVTAPSDSIDSSSLRCKLNRCRDEREFTMSPELRRGTHEG